MERTQWANEDEINSEFNDEFVRDSFSAIVKKEYDHRRVRRGALILSGRDLRLLKTILEQKFVTRSQVIEYFFGGAKSYGEIRIRKLKKAGFLKTVKPFTLEPEMYLLGKEGYAVLKETQHDKVYFDYNDSVALHPAKQIDIANYVHDKMVNEVRFMLEKMELVNDWVSEKALRTVRGSSVKVPDGMCSINKGKAFVEVELHAKKKKTYEKIFSYYHKRKQAHDYVLYVCKNYRMMKRLIKVHDEMEFNDICFVVYSDFEESRSWTPVYKRNGKAIGTLGSL